MCSYQKPRPGFRMPYAVFCYVVNGLRWEVVVFACCWYWRNCWSSLCVRSYLNIRWYTLLYKGYPKIWHLFHIWSLQKINNIFGCFWIVDTKPIDHSGGIMVSFKCGRSWVPAPVRSNRCSTVRNTALRNKNKDWLSRNRDNVTEWNDLSTLGFYWTRIMKSNSACWSHPNLIL